MFRNYLILISIFLFLPSLQSLQSKEYPSLGKLNLSKKPASVKFNIFLQDQPFKAKNCRLILSTESLPEGKNTFETTINDDSEIKLNEGIWKLEVFYSYGVSPFRTTIHLRKRKKYQQKINLYFWSPLKNFGYQTGKIFDPDMKQDEGINHTIYKNSLEGVDFYGIRFLSSTAPKKSSFLVNWLVNRKYWGRMWYASKLPFGVPVIKTSDKIPTSSLLTMRSRGGMLFYYHPGNGAMTKPITLKHSGTPSLKKYFENVDYYYPKMAASLVFDTIAGPLYDGLDLNIYDKRDLAIWYTLLNMGYRIPGICSTVSRGLKPEWAWTFLQSSADSNLDQKFEAMKKGKAILSSDPVLIFKIGDAFPGDEIRADNKIRQMDIFTMVDPRSWDRIKSIEIIRNGKTYKKSVFDKLKNQYRIRYQHVFEKEFAWYIVIVKTKDGKVAVSNPIYYIPLSYSRPQPARSYLKIKPQDPDQNFIKGVSIKCLQTTKTLWEKTSDSLLKEEMTVPLSAQLEFTHPLYRTKIIPVSSLVDLITFQNDLISFKKGGPAKLADPKTYKDLRKLFLRINSTITLYPK